MIILQVYPIIKWAERINRCTVRGARTSQGSFKQFATTLRRRRKRTRLEPPATTVNQRNSENLKSRIIVPKILNRRGSRRPDGQKRFPTSRSDYDSRRG